MRKSSGARSANPACGASSSAKRPRTSEVMHQFGRHARGCAGERHDGYPLPHLVETKNGERVAYRTDLHAESECRRIEVTQQLVGQGGLVLDDVFQDGQFGLRLVDFLKQLIVAVFVRRYIPGLKGFRLAEEISLEERVAHLAGFFIMARASPPFRPET